MICGIWVQFPPTPLVPITLNWFESALRLPLHFDLGLIRLHYMQNVQLKTSCVSLPIIWGIWVQYPLHTHTHTQTCTPTLK